MKRKNEERHPETRRGISGMIQLATTSSTIFAFAFPNQALSLIAMGLWLGFGPFFVYEGLRWLIRILRRDFPLGGGSPIERYPPIVHFALGWLAGLLFFFLFSLIASLIGLFSFGLLVSVTLGLFAVSFIGNAASLWRYINHVVELTRNTTKQHLALVAVTLSSVAVMFAAIRGFSPPPFQFGWDMFQHAYVANIVRDQGLFHSLPSAFSNSFIVDPYTTSFHLLLALVSFLGNGDVLLVFWIGPLFTLLVFALGIIFLGQRIGLGLILILGAVAFGIAFQEWNKGFSLVYFAPASIITAFTPLMLGAQLSLLEFNRRLETHLASASIILLHFFFGVALVLVAYSIPTIRQVLKGRSVTPRSASVGLVLLGSLTIIIPLVAWESYNALFRSMSDYFVSFENVFWTVGLSWKIAAITQVYYSLPLLAAAIAGALFVATRTLIGRKSGLNLRLSFLILLMFGGILVYLIELEQTSRFLFLVRPGLVLTASLFVVQLARGVSIKRTGVVIVSVILLILVSSVFPASTFIQRQRFEGDTGGVATSFNDNEMEMGLWIRDNLPPGAVLLSDPRSQSTLLPFAMRETFFGHEMPLEYQNLLRTVFSSNSSETAIEAIRRIAEMGEVPLESVYLVVSGRTLFWAQSSLIHIYRPKALTDPSPLEHLVPPHFNMRHAVDGEVFIYRLEG